jgi:hypothetical protein
MAKVVRKYAIDVSSIQEIKMPKDSQVLTAQMQGGTLQLWALVDPDEAAFCQSQYRRIIVVGTGHTILQDSGLNYVATVQIPTEAMGPLVFHVFDGGVF